MSESRSRGPFPAWRYPQYRLLWISTFGGNIARWIDVLIVAWLVLVMTDSPFLVGLCGALRGFGMVLGPFCGAIADRFGRRRVLIVEQAALLAGALVVMSLFLYAKLEVWHLFAYVFIGGIGHAFDFSTRYALAADIVENRDVTNAVSLLFSTSSVTSGLGPLIGGGLLDIIQPAGTFALIAAGSLVSLSTLLAMKQPYQQPPRREPVWRNLTGGLKYLGSDRALLALIFIAALINLFLASLRQTVTPVFARETLRVGAGGFGLLMGMSGLGAFIGSLAAGALGNMGDKRKLFIAGALAWPTMYIIFSTSRLFYVALSTILLVGMAEGITFSLLQALLLKWSAVEMRGRVSGMRAFAISTLLAGNPLVGAMAGSWGPPATIVVFALGYLATTAAAVAWGAGAWKRKESSDVAGLQAG